MFPALNGRIAEVILVNVNGAINYSLSTQMDYVL